MTTGHAMRAYRRAILGVGIGLLWLVAGCAAPRVVPCTLSCCYHPTCWHMWQCGCMAQRAAETPQDIETPLPGLPEAAPTGLMEPAGLAPGERVPVPPPQPSAEQPAPGAGL